MSTISPFARPLYVMLKPVGAACNLRCEYCYYLEKSNLYRDAQKRVLSEEMLEQFTKEYIEAQTSPDILFTWHGGEPLMRPLTFYRKAVELQRKYGAGRRISNSIQTNGTLLNDEWCRFLRENNWLVGISIDGPQEFHDEFRRHRLGRTDMAEGDARHTPAEEARRGVERDGGGERLQRRLSARLLPLLQGERMPVPAVHAYR